MKILKKVAAACILCVILLLFCFFGVSMVLKTDHIRHFVLAEINKNIPGTISWTENRFSVFRGIADLKNVLLKEPDGDLLISLERLRVDISWLDLLTGNLTIESAFVEKPQVFLAEDEDGTLNLLKAFGVDDESSIESSDTGFPFNIVIKKAQISSGSLRYDLSDDDRIILPSVDLELLHGNLFKQEAKLLLRLTHCKLNMGKQTIGLESVNLRTAFVKDRLAQLSAIVKTSGKSSLIITGNIRNLFGDIHPELEARLTGDASDILKTALLDADITGGISIYLKTSGSLHDPEAMLDLKYTGGDIAGNRIDHADIGCRLEKRVVIIDRAFINTLYGAFQLSGKLDLQHVFPDGLLSSRRNPDALLFNILITQKDMLLEKLPGIPEGLAGQCRTEATLNGKGFSASSLSARLKLKLSAVNFSIGEFLKSKKSSFVTVIADIDNRRFAVENFEVNSGEIKVSATGEYDLNSMDINGRLSAEIKLPAGEFLVSEAENVRGDLNLCSWISGKAGNPLIRGRLKGEGIGYREINLGKLSGEMLFSDGMISFDRMIIQNGQSELDFSGSVQLIDFQTNQVLREPLFDICVSGEKIFLEEFSSKVKGEISLAGDVAGSLSFPVGNMRLEGKNIDPGVQKIKEVNLRSYLDGETLFIDECGVEFAEGEEIQAGGWLSLAGDYNFFTTTAGISLNHVDWVADQDWRTAEIFFDFHGRGSFEDPRLSGKIGLRGLQWNEEKIDPFLLKVDVIDRKAKIEGEKGMPLNAEYNLETKEITGEVRAEALDLAPWFKFAGFGELDGVLDSVASITGDLNTPDQIQGQVRISRLEVDWQQKELLRARDLAIDLANGILRVPKNRLLILKEGYLNAGGKAELKGMVDFKAEGKVPMRVAELFFDEVSEAEGMVTCNASISGSIKNPNAYADLGFEKIGLQISYFYEPLHELKGRLRFTSDKVTAENVTGRFDSGGFDLEGIIELEQYRPDSANVNLTAHAIPILVGDHTELLLNTDLNIQGTQKASAITGEIIILEGSYTQDVNLKPLEYVMSQSRDEKPVSGKKETSFFDNTSFDVIVQSRNPFMIDNNIALLLLRPDFHFQGTLERPLISGRAKVESGIIKYQGKEFEVTRGIIDFINPYRIEPSIELEGRIQVQEWIVFLSVEGTAENLKFSLKSDPPESEGAILNLLVFGTSPREDSNGEDGKILYPGEILAGLMSDRIQADIKDTTGLDSVEFEYKGSDAETETGRVKVEVGKELSTQFAVKYGIETSNSKVVRRTVTEYKFRKNLILDAYQDSEGDYGGGVQYKIEFR